MDVIGITGRAPAVRQSDASAAEFPAPLTAGARLEPGPAIEPVAVTRAVAKLNESLADHATNVRFEVSHDGKRLVVSVIDISTSEVLRQIPSEETLRINEYVDRLQGLAVRSEA